MLNSLSRGRSTARPSYICISCLNSILGHVAAPSVGATNEIKTFSTTANCDYRQGRPGARRPSSTLVSNSTATLNALKQVLLLEDTEKATGPPTNDGAKKTATASDKKPKSTKPPLSVLKKKSVQESKNEDQADENVTSKKTKKVKKSILVNTTEAKVKEKVNGSRSIKLGKDLESGRSTKIKRQLRLRRVESKGVPMSIMSALGISRPLVGENSTREALVKIIESGAVSPDEAVKAISKLRAGLLQRGADTLPNPDAVRSIGEEIRSFDSIKDGMQRKRIEVASTKKNPPDRLSRQLLHPRLGVSRKTSKVVTVKTGPLKAVDIKTAAADELNLVPLERPQEPVPRLSYGLERVLFNPGVYQLQDPRSRVFNFDPYLQTIMPVNEFDFNALKQYITSSRDQLLLDIAKDQGKKYTGSTSSMSAALAHFHFLLSQWRPVNTGMLSNDFPVEFKSFTALQRGPSAIFLRYKNGTYAIDADKEYDSANILSMLGKSMEKLLTLPTENFEKYRKENSDQISEEDRNEPEAFNYTTMGDFLLRSQLDAYDPRLPGTGMFDLKTRAVASIRMDTKSYEHGRGYEIRSRQGEWESYEREYYDMIRAAFLKYSLQVRMGRMDGIFVAFHNTQRIFGFQYISLPEMDNALHGTEDTTIGDSEFKLSLDLLNQVLNRATEKYPEKSLRLHFETRGGTTPFMYIFAEPMEEDQIDEIQASNRDAIMKFERNILGLDQKTDEELAEEKKKAEWETLRAQVEASMEKDELDIQAAREMAEAVLEESEFWDELSPQEKESAINELIDSSAFDDAEEDQSGTIPVNDGEDEAEEDEDSNSMEEDEDEVEIEEDEDLNKMEEEEIDLDEDEEVEERGEDSELLDPDSEAGAETQEDGSDGSKESTSDISEVSVDEDKVVKHNDTFEEAESIPPNATSKEPVESTKSGKDAQNLPKDIFAMTLTIRNLVNGDYVERPTKINKDDKWTIEYALVNISNERVGTIYASCKKRRWKTLAEAKKSTTWNSSYLTNLRKLSERGREWRESQDELDATSSLKRVDGGLKEEVK